LAGQKIGAQVVLAEAGQGAQIEPGFALLARERAQGGIPFGGTFFAHQVPQIARGALKPPWPSLSILREYPETPRLMSYGAPLIENFRRAAIYVDKILNGANPAQLPFEQPTKYGLVINLKTAKALGLAIPPSLLGRADHVIE